MAFYHVNITRRSYPPRPEIKLDLSEQLLEDRVLRPYQDGHPIVIRGTNIPPDDIARIKITCSEESSEHLATEAKRRMYAKGDTMALYTSIEAEIFKLGKDVTDDLITGPPGQGISTNDEPNEPDIKGSKVVFVVHGRNLKARDALNTFLYSLGLHPLDWAEAVQETGHASPYIGDILDKAFSVAQAVIALMTPDDEARLREPYRDQSDPLHEVELTTQARPNVLFEAGMAMGKFPERTILVELGSLRPFSDVAGRHTIRLNNSSQRRQELALRLQNTGCPVNMNGSDWHTLGDFEAALSDDCD